MENRNQHKQVCTHKLYAQSRYWSSNKYQQKHNPPRKCRQISWHALGQKLSWANRIKLKRKSLNLKLHQPRQLLRSKNLPLKTKLLVYKQLIRPIITYGIQLWGAVKSSNVETLQSFQSNAPRYMSNYIRYITT